MSIYLELGNSPALDRDKLPPGAGVIDIMFNDDLEIKDGDWAICESDNQHIEHIFMAAPGQYKQWPTIGINIGRYRHGNVNRAKLHSEISRGIAEDSYLVRRVVIEHDTDGLHITPDTQRK